jgi:hypothetical protein
MASKLLPAFVLAALVVSACAGGTATTQASGPDTTSEVADRSAATADPDVEPEPASDPPDATADLVASEECAAESTSDAADTFDEGGLQANAGSGFKPLDDPVMVAADEVTWLDPDDLVMGIYKDGEAQAYPVGQMIYHHVANTSVAGEPYLVTY